MASESAGIEERRVELQRFHEGSPIGRHLGMRLSFEGEEAILDLPHDPRLDHALGATHGGVIATLIDNAGWFAAALRYDCWIATVEFSVRLLEPATRSHLRARGRLVRGGERLAVAEMEVRDGEGALVAVGSGTYTVTRLSRTTP